MLYHRHKWNLICIVKRGSNLKRLLVWWSFGILILFFRVWTLNTVQLKNINRTASLSGRVHTDYTISQWLTFLLIVFLDSLHFIHLSFRLLSSQRSHMNPALNAWRSAWSSNMSVHVSATDHLSSGATLLTWRCFFQSTRVVWIMTALTSCIRNNFKSMCVWNRAT